VRKVCAGEMRRGKKSRREEQDKSQDMIALRSCIEAIEVLKPKFRSGVKLTEFYSEPLWDVSIGEPREDPQLSATTPR
jgi:hypothetical protein